VLNGYWVDAVDRAGIRWVTGALSNDANILMRVHKILQSFEYLTTNNAASHIPYAAI